ncbi:MAG TPA: hypothetical protein VEX68_14770, partial [Bryobacteraceae bacterium]|nr:hypothetical protein [Bryobacteraceae bacterium]
YLAFIACHVGQCLKSDTTRIAHIVLGCMHKRKTPVIEDLIKPASKPKFAAKAAYPNRRPLFSRVAVTEIAKPKALSRPSGA